MDGGQEPGVADASSATCNVALWCDVVERLLFTVVLEDTGKAKLLYDLQAYLG